MSVIIGGIQKSSLLDYPEKIAAIVFTQGCNFRCGYCHNPELLKSNVEKSAWNALTFLDFLKTRKNKLDGVVITGGEPCLQVGLKEFIKEIKDLGFLVKLDTNGSFPDVLGDLIEENLIDYIAMDIKAPFEKYNKIVKVSSNSQNIKNSINLIMNSGVDYEFRTTVLKKLLDFDDFEKIGEMIKGAKNYYIQKFVSSKIFDNALINEKNYNDCELDIIVNSLKDSIENIYVR